MSAVNPPPRKTWQPPTVEELQPELPQYEISGLLGRGGMGAVYRAWQKSLKREVAIKVLPPMMEDADMHFAERFKAEAESMARLSHPGIVAVYDAGETPGGLLYFVMEFVQGTDVRQMIAAAGRLPPAHAHAIAACVCDALAYAHASGLIHRDIKPANVMVDTQGRVKVADFGLVKLLDEDGELTLTTMAVGTPDFMAPEALVPGAPVDARADLYAVGVMLYQMLTGNLPRGAWHPASTLVPEVDPRFDEIIVKAMQLNRNARHSSALEMRAHLDSLLIPMVPLVQEHSSAGMPKQARSKLPLMIGLGVAAAIFAVAFFTMGGQNKPMPTAVTASPATAKPVALAKAVSPPLQGSATALQDAPAPKAASTAKSSPGLQSAKPASAPTALSNAPAPSAAKQASNATSSPAPSATPMPSAGGLKSGNTPPPTTAVATAPANQKSTLPSELATMDAAFIRNQQERVTAPFEAEVAKLNASYLGGIATKISAEKAAGNLDGIVALEAEQKLITDKRSVPDADDATTPASLKTLRMIYRTSHAQLEVTRAANLKKLTDPFRVWLTATEADLLKKDRVADAKIVRGYREAMDSSHAGPRPAVVSQGESNRVATKANGNGLKPSTTPSPGTLVASKGEHTNSLGMKFAAVKGTDVLFCIHETRYQDYAVYAADSPGVDILWKSQGFDGLTITARPEQHPVTNISWEYAQQFCTWLSRKEGRKYRLPTDREWSIAVGIGREEKWLADTTPSTVFKPPGEYPWGDKWPIPKGAGNYGGMSRPDQVSNALRSYFEGYDDGYPLTAPVMSYKPNRFGLYDMGGNVYEWCEDWYDNTQKHRVLRGASLIDNDSAAMLSSYRYHKEPGSVSYGRGFRVVLEAASLIPQPR
ncbi:MAG: protein kinase [Prosthecobacter sp.]